ncbi:MAG: hypothetical protein O8C61_08155 [Candidatus Methanoperedens sp.]|nr:hypothetical protein [Candidatus Methanoperedens sp.]
MDPNLLQELLNLYSWGIASLIVIILAAIALFYQNKFGINTYYYFYIIPVIIFVIVRLQFFAVFSKETEFMEFIGSVISFLVTFSLYRKMVGVK